jgi:hypothetical protein
MIFNVTFNNISAISWPSYLCTIGIWSVYKQHKGPPWSWSCDSWIYNYLCIQCLSQVKLCVRIPLIARCTAQVVVNPTITRSWPRRPFVLFVNWSYSDCAKIRGPGVLICTDRYISHTFIWKSVISEKIVEVNLDAITKRQYLCIQCLSQVKLCVRIPLIARCTRYNIMW